MNHVNSEDVLGLKRSAVTNNFPPTRLEITIRDYVCGIEKVTTFTLGPDVMAGGDIAVEEVRLNELKQTLEKTGLINKVVKFFPSDYYTEDYIVYILTPNGLWVVKEKD